MCTIGDGDDHDRLQADVEAVNVFLSTCGEPTGTPVFIAEENKELGHAPQIPENLQAQDNLFQAASPGEAEPLENPGAVGKKEKKGTALTVLRTLGKTQECWGTGRGKPVPSRRE